MARGSLQEWLFPASISRRTRRTVGPTGRGTRMNPRNRTPPHQKRIRLAGQSPPPAAPPSGPPVTPLTVAAVAGTAACTGAQSVSKAPETLPEMIIPRMARVRRMREKGLVMTGFRQFWQYLEACGGTGVPAAGRRGSLIPGEGLALGAAKTARLLRSGSRYGHAFIWSVQISRFDRSAWDMPGGRREEQRRIQSAQSCLFANLCHEAQRRN